MAVPPLFRAPERPRAMLIPGQPVTPGIGEGLQALGEGLSRSAEIRAAADERVAQLDHQAALIEKENQQRAERSDVAVRFATMQGTLQGSVAEMRASAPAGAVGHEAAVGKLLDEQTLAFLDGITDPEIRQQFQPDVAQLRARVTSGEQAFAIGQRAKAEATNFEALTGQLGANLFTDPSDASLQLALGVTEKQIAAMPLPDDAKNELRRDAREKLTLSAWQGVLQVNPTGALEAIQKGTFNSVFNGQQLAAMSAQAQAKIAQIEAQQRAAVSQATGEANEADRLVVEQVNDGVAADVGELRGRAAAARARGEEGLAYDLDRAADKSEVNALYGAATPNEIAQQRNTITGTKGWEKDPRQVARVTALDTLLSQARQEVKTDALSRAARASGKVLVPLDLNDAMSVGARLATARDARARYGGRLQLLTPDEAATIKQQLDAGRPADRAALISVFADASRRHDEPDLAEAALRQIAPGRADYVWMSTLAAMRDRSVGRAHVQQALDGYERLKANPKLIDEGAARREFQIETGSALSRLAGPDQGSLWSVAKGIYASRATAAGAEVFDRDLWRQAVRDAAGAAGNTGGIVDWRRGEKVLLPTGMTRGNLEVTIARADDKALAQYGSNGRGPMFRDRMVTAAELKRLVPVALDNEGFYAFRDASGNFLSGAGGLYVLDVKRLARGLAQ
ncbi:hypothetical protein FHS96_004989 [Sphingomonas zeicaulis]|uniref:hypothetical protein n=1 Tax=Sphingomonas zeicaulis TaxID=1632740 RepID=UPI003D25CEC9